MHLRILRNKFVATIIFLLFGLVGFAQEDEEYWKKFLNEEVEVANPVYKPVISFGAGVLSSWGDIKNPGTNPLSGEFGYKVNVSTLFGKKNFFKLNFFVMMGSLRGHDFDISRQMQLGTLPLDDNLDPIYPNSSFSTSIFQFGMNVEYGFGHFTGKLKQFRPFISLGVAPIQYSPKGDLTYDRPDGTSAYYHYWSDGTIRNFSQNGPDAWKATIINQDHTYETDLSKINMYGLGSYSQISVAFPLEVGFDFYLSDRVSLRVASSINYTLTDLLDNYDDKVAKLYGSKSNGYSDIFSFTYFTMNFDLFSDPKTMMIEKAFADLDDFAYELIDDQDNDMVYDRWDHCPDTPNGVEVDTAFNSSTYGCPLDSDNDGVYDYMDQEQNTTKGATVDDKGVQLTQDKLSEMFEQKNAVSRKEIKVVPIAPIWTRSVTFTPGVIPDKFKAVDIDGDGYISFPELLKTVDAYFDEKTDFKPEDIYELNNFFFSQ